MIRLWAAIATLLLTSACAGIFTTFPATEEYQEQVSTDITVVVLSAQNISQYYRPEERYTRSSFVADDNWEYRIGVGDVLNILVFDHPELMLPTPNRSDAQAPGFRVQADGTFFYPFIGQIKAKGRTVQDVRLELSQKLATFIPDPQVEVQISEFNSQSVVVSGEVEKPRQVALDTVALTLLEAINEAGGWTELADMSRVSVRRDGKRHTVDLKAYLKANAQNNNPVLHAGDVVHVPERRILEAFLLGEINDPDTVDLSKDPISLTQAVTKQGGPRNVRSDARGVFVFRQVDNKTHVFQLVTSDPSGWLLGTRFTLEPRDVVYVTRSPLQAWNDVISLLLPTVRAVISLDDITI